MVLTKDKSELRFLCAVLIALPFWAHGYCFWRGGFTTAALNVHLYILPFTILFILFAYAIHRSLTNRLIISDSGLLVEDFSPIEFPWNKIRRVSTKSQLLPRGGACLWLVLHTSCDEVYMNPKIRKINQWIGMDGIPVCNLGNYSGNLESFIEAIKQRVQSTY